MTSFPNLKLQRFQNRVGKINIINELHSQCDQKILIMTDANVMFSEDAIRQLVAQFKDDRVGLVAANIIKLSDKNEGIAIQERAYLSIENRIKSAESKAFAYIMGAEGGCYAIRNSLFTKVPGKFIVDDFYITLQLILRGKKALFNEAAICFEDVPGDSQGEYRRKVRISSGNFQNLFFFRHLLYRFWRPLGFMFWSHKVLRWMTPFFLCFAFVASAFLGADQMLFRVLFFSQVLGLLTPLINHWLPFKNNTLRFVSHFYLMNMALLAGFFRFTSGIQSSVWQPVKRDV
jgi:cellulose synthase/poly-beta-1,6-N-acetylglucosamine synthase-like glycosyltransferase